MATGPAVSSALETISRHHLECSICQGRYQQPKILECLHNFCEQCLLKYCSKKHQGAVEIPCPVCRQETKLPEVGVEGLKTNFHLIGLVEELELQEKFVCSGGTKLLCETCDDGNEATRRCLDCAQNICSRCHSSHKRIATTSSHTIATLEDICEGKVKLTKENLKQHPKCPKHEGEVTRFFCMTCEVLICRDCTVIDHCKPEHSYIDRNQAASTYKQSLAELFSPLGYEMKELKKSQEKVSRIKEDLGVTVKRVRTEVQDRAAEIRAEVTAQENRILNDIKNIQTDREQKLDDCEKTMGLAAERFQYSLDTAREVTRTASDSDFLSLYPTISKDLKLLADQRMPRVDNRLAFLKFKQSEGVGGISLGEVVVEVEWKLCCDREFGRIGRGPGEFYGAWGIAARQPDEIAVTDYCNKRVVICSIDGDQKSMIPMQGCPLGIAATRAGDRLVVVEEGASHVKVFNSNNTLAYEFPTVPPSDEVDKTAVDLHSVAVKNDDTIVVGDARRMVLTEHSPTDGELLRTIPVKIKPYFLAVDDSNDRIVISDKSQAVDVADGNGTTRRTIKPTMNDEPVQYCNGVYTDSSGIYVAMENGPSTRHIHHYDPQGGFLKCIAQGLHSPRGITLTSDGQLAVADWYSIKIIHHVAVTL
ncbi:tripartite motif-containing protein 72-like [Patiria miniata]|uniref:Tripartite motif-containing protein 2-like n=1 Tax=Patiria miniata TaxID=46514 RepID=A0A914AHS9_PATMI|nr:tripartite motif-containing protein 72-like [Patiria miniata]